MKKWGNLREGVLEVVTFYANAFLFLVQVSLLMSRAGEKKKAHQTNTQMNHCRAFTSVVSGDEHFHSLPEQSFYVYPQRLPNAPLPKQFDKYVIRER